MASKDSNLFSKDTQCIFYNYKSKPAQRMLDFDFLCGEGLQANISFCGCLPLFPDPSRLLPLLHE